MGGPVDEVPRVPAFPRLKAWLAWLITAAALGPFILYLLLTAIANLLDDE